MIRGWIIAAALVSITAAPLLAQQPAPNRYAQRAAQVPPRTVAAQQTAAAVPQAAPAAPRYHVDPMVQQAAVANTNSRSRSPRDAQQNSRSTAKKSGVSSFFSRFKLPSFGGATTSKSRNSSRPPIRRCRTIRRNSNKKWARSPAASNNGPLPTLDSNAPPLRAKRRRPIVPRRLAPPRKRLRRQPRLPLRK